MLRRRCSQCGEKEWPINLMDYWYQGNTFPSEICQSCYKKLEDERLEKRSKDLAYIASIRKEEVELIQMEKEMKKAIDNAAKNGIKLVTAEHVNSQSLKALLADFDHYLRTGQWDVTIEEAGQYMHTIKSIVYEEEKK